MLASVFMSQDKKGNFLLLPKSGRKDLFAELLGLLYLGLLSVTFGERRKTHEQSMATDRALLASIEKEIKQTFIRYLPKPEIPDDASPVAADWLTLQSTERVFNNRTGQLFGRISQARFRQQRGSNRPSRQMRRICALKRFP